MGKKFSILLLSVLLIGISYSQKLTDWKNLEVNKLQQITDTVARITFDAPVFNEEQQELDGQKISVEGYLTKMETDGIGSGALYMLQRYKQSDYGAEYPLDAIIEVEFKKEPKSVKSDEKVVIKGMLKLNTDDFMHPFYILQEAKVR